MPWFTLLCVGATVLLPVTGTGTTGLLKRPGPVITLSPGSLEEVLERRAQTVHLSLVFLVVAGQQTGNSVFLLRSRTEGLKPAAPEHFSSSPEAPCKKTF